MQSARAVRRSPWAWIPSLYFAEGLPNVIVVTIAVVMYKRLGLSDTDIAFYTSWLYLPWVIKPFWSPIVETLKTKRWWIVAMELFIGATLAGVAFTLPLNHFLCWSLAFFWLVAFSSATHDIAADGFYMISLDSHEQSLFVGIRSTFYRIAMIAGQALLLKLSEIFEIIRRPAVAWSWVFGIVAVSFLLITCYHSIFLPRAQEDTERNEREFSFMRVLKSNIDTFTTFFRKPGIVTAIVFLLLYRLPEAMLAKISPLFLIEKMSRGGLGLTPGELGITQGTVGALGLTLGGIIGGICVAKGGFRKWLWPMVCAITLPDCVYLLLAYYQPENLWWVNIGIGLEQFGYGFGFTSYMLYMLYFSQGTSKTAHYAFCTGIMALSLMLPGMVAGWLADTLGYYRFFMFVVALIPLTFLAAAMVKVPADFGLKQKHTH